MSASIQPANQARECLLTVQEEADKKKERGSNVRGRHARPWRQLTEARHIAGAS